MSKNKKQYWMCLIGPVGPNKYKGNGADLPLRMAVRDKFNEIFGPDEVCASGWGISQERYEALRILHMFSTEKLIELCQKKK